MCVDVDSSYDIHKLTPIGVDVDSSYGIHKLKPIGVWMSILVMIFTN